MICTLTSWLQTDILRNRPWLSDRMAADLTRCLLPVLGRVEGLRAGLKLSLTVSNWSLVEAGVRSRALVIKLILSTVERSV